VTREQLEHAIRAACDVAKETEVYVFGSQAILGQYPDAPEALRMSAEADMAPKNFPDRADLIDGSLGELSMFHDRLVSGRSRLGSEQARGISRQGPGVRESPYCRAHGITEGARRANPNAAGRRHKQTGDVGEDDRRGTWPGRHLNRTRAVPRSRRRRVVWL